MIIQEMFWPADQWLRLVVFPWSRRNWQTQTCSKTWKNHGLNLGENLLLRRFRLLPYCPNCSCLFVTCNKCKKYAAGPQQLLLVTTDFSSLVAFGKGVKTCPNNLLAQDGRCRRLVGAVVSISSAFRLALCKWATKTTFLLSMEYWLFHRDPYNGSHYIPHIR